MAPPGAAQQHDPDEQVTLAEALDNEAMRNAILSSVLTADALSPSAKEKIGVHVLGMLLSLSAGAVNAIAFAKFEIYVSHVTGHSSSIGLRREGMQPGEISDVSEIILFFIVGSFVAGLIIPKATLKMGQARYELVLFLVAALQLLCWWHDLRHPQMLAVAMGLQNAMATSWSGAVLRTTHMTGTATDLGSAIGRIIARFLRAGCSPRRSLTDQDWDDHTVDRQKVVLMTILLASYILGGIVGASMYNNYRLHALLLPAGVCSLLGVLHLGYVLANREDLAEKKEEEAKFTRQISETVDKGRRDSGLPSPRGDPRMEQFIRQISNGSKAERPKQETDDPVMEAMKGS